MPLKICKEKKKKPFHKIAILTQNILTIFSQLLIYQFLISQNKIIKYETGTKSQLKINVLWNYYNILLLSQHFHNNFTTNPK